MDLSDLSEHLNFSSAFLCLGVDMTVAKLHSTLSMAGLACQDLQRHFGFWGLNPWI